MKKWLTTVAGWFGFVPKNPERPVPAEIRKVERQMNARRAAIVAGMRSPKREVRVQAFMDLFPVPKPPPWIPDADQLATDIAEDIKPHYEHAMDWGGTNGSLPSWSLAGWHAASEGIGFFGFPYLAELTQRTEYRLISEIRAEEMTRKWIEFTYDGKKDDQNDKLKALQDWTEKHEIQNKWNTLLLQDGEFGRSHLYIDTGATENPKELRTRLVRKSAKIKKDSIIGFITVEALWTYPNRYNASDPLKPNYFKPETWFVMGKLVHHTRLITVVSRPLPDLLKTAYAFAGLSMSQMAKPYVDNWLNARQSVNDLLRAFSTMILATDTQSALQGGDGEELNDRIDLFNAHRSNFGTMVINKNEEELTNIAVPLSSLDKLQAQAQEHMATPSKTPLVKLFGITPSGLNASSDGEIRAFYDGIHAEQERVIRAPLMDLLVIGQLDLFGTIDKRIGFDFVSLWELDEVAKASIRKTDADTAAVLIANGSLDPQEDRTRIAEDEGSPYKGINPKDMPEQPEADPDAEEPVKGAGPSAGGDPAKSAEPKTLQRSPV